LLLNEISWFFLAFAPPAFVSSMNRSARFVEEVLIKARAKRRLLLNQAKTGGNIQSFHEPAAGSKESEARPHFALTDSVSGQVTLFVEQAGVGPRLWSAL
jgi:hypothetical protein